MLKQVQHDHTGNKRNTETTSATLRQAQGGRRNPETKKLRNLETGFSPQKLRNLETALAHRNSETQKLRNGFSHRNPETQKRRRHRNGRSPSNAEGIETAPAIETKKPRNAEGIETAKPQKII